MDMVIAYEENGYKEQRNQLREDERAFLTGYKAAVENVLEAIRDNCEDYIDNDIETTLGKLEAEITRNAGEKLAATLYITWHEIITSMLDEHGDDESDGTGKISQSWKLPEPPELDDDEENNEGE